MLFFSDLDGPWQPLRSGMPIPAAGVGESPQSHLCFSTAWQPAVYQALSLLLRPEAWQGDLAAVRAVILDAHELVEGIEPGCQGCPNWQWSIGANSICTEISQAPRFQAIDDCVCEHPRAFYATAANVVFGTAVYRLALFGKDYVVPTSPAGGHVCQFTAVQLGTVIGNVWDFQWRDCLGALHQETSPDFFYEKRDFVAKDICISSAAPFSISISIDGNYLCGVA